MKIIDAAWSFGNLVIAAICGMLIGLERARRSKEAGVRTHLVVCMSAALMTIVSRYIGAGDPGRIAAQIVSGIGFLGAGMIFFRRESLRGLTTAAGIWLTAAIGMAAGAAGPKAIGFYIIAVAATLFLLFVQAYFHSKKCIFRQKEMHLLNVKFDYSAETVRMLEEMFAIKMFKRIKIYSDKDDELKAEAVIHTDKDCSAAVLTSLMYQNKHITSFERLEDL